MEDKIGSLEVGKYADIVILEENLFDVPPRNIADVKVLATMMNGKFTYQSQGETSQNDIFSKERQLASANFFRWFYHGEQEDRGVH